MKTYALPVSIIILAVTLLVSVFFWNANNAISSVQHGGEYTVTELSTGTSTVYTLPGTVGSFVVSSSSRAATISVYATTSQATSSADSYLDFEADAAEGTYTYDVAIPHGILIDVPSAFNGNVDLVHRR